MTDEEAIRNCVGRYFQLLDDRDFEQWRTLLTEHPRITINGSERWPPSLQVTGQRGRHIAANLVIDLNIDEATATFDYFYIAEMGPPRFERIEFLNAGRYTDRLVRHEGRWLIHEVAMDVFLS